MKKSKHFRKDVILARVIAGVVLLVVISLIIFVVSFFMKPDQSEQQGRPDRDTQQVQDDLPEYQDTEEVEDTQSSIDEGQSETADPNVDSESSDENKIYIKTTTQVKLRAEANTSCATLDRIDGGTTIEVLEVLDGWYKVTHNGQEGYVSATYVTVVE